MRKKNTHIGRIALGAVTVAALMGGSAFTADNTFTNTSNLAGYGQSQATGATVTDISYTTVTGDSTKLASVVFTTTTNVTGHTASLTLKDAGTKVGSSYKCDLGAWGTTSMTITCSTADNPDIASFDTTGLTVVQ